MKTNRTLKHFLMVATLGALCGCSLLTQDQRTALSVSQDGVVSIEATGYRPGDMAMSTSVDPLGTITASFVTDKTGLYSTVIASEDRALLAFEEYHGLRSGGVAPADALELLLTTRGGRGETVYR